MKKPSLVILISGSGSNLQAIINAINNHQLNAEIKTVISNQVSAKGLNRAASENITTHVVDHKSYPSRKLFDQAEIANYDENEYLEYEESLKNYRDLKNSIDTAFDDGKLEGLEQGIEQGIEKGVEQGIEHTARNMKNDGFTVEKIIKYTGLSKEQIEKL